MRSLGSPHTCAFESGATMCPVCNTVAKCTLPGWGFNNLVFGITPVVLVSLVSCTSICSADVHVFSIGTVLRPSPPCATITSRRRFIFFLFLGIFVALVPFPVLSVVVRAQHIPLLTF